MVGHQLVYQRPPGVRVVVNAVKTALTNVKLHPRQVGVNFELHCTENAIQSSEMRQITLEANHK